MQISASYDFVFNNEDAAINATATIERILADKGLDMWTPNQFDCKVMTYGEYIDWDIYEELVTEMVKAIAIATPNEAFSGTSRFDNLSVGQCYGMKIAYNDMYLTIESGVNLLNNSSGTKFCPYCGEEYDVEAIQMDIDDGEFLLNDDGSFNCFQCDMQISLSELTEAGASGVSATYELKDGVFTLK